MPHILLSVVPSGGPDRLVELERDLDAMQESREDEIADIKDQFNNRLDQLENILTGGQPNGR